MPLIDQNKINNKEEKEISKQSFDYDYFDEFYDENMDLLSLVQEFEVNGVKQDEEEDDDPGEFPPLRFV